MLGAYELMQNPNRRDPANSREGRRGGIFEAMPSVAFRLRTSPSTLGTSSSPSTNLRNRSRVLGRCSWRVFVVGIGEVEQPPHLSAQIDQTLPAIRLAGLRGRRRPNRGQAQPRSRLANRGPRFRDRPRSFVECREQGETPPRDQFGGYRAPKDRKWPQPGRQPPGRPRRLQARSRTRHCEIASSDQRAGSPKRTRGYQDIGDRSTTAPATLVTRCLAVM